MTKNVLMKNTIDLIYSLTNLLYLDCVLAEQIYRALFFPPRQSSGLQVLLSTQCLFRVACSFTEVVMTFCFQVIHQLIRIKKHFLLLLPAEFMPLSQGYSLSQV